jgi:hypothetical protein
MSEQTRTLNKAIQSVKDAIAAEQGRGLNSESKDMQVALRWLEKSRDQGRIQQ